MSDESQDPVEGDGKAPAAESSPKTSRRTEAAGKGRAEPRKRGERRSDEEEETRWDRMNANARTIGGAVLLAIFIRIVLFEAFEIDGPSMQPSLLHGDRVVVAKFMFGLFLPAHDEASFTWGMPHPGDVVIVKSPADGVDIVKRVVGVEGDSIEVRDSVVYRNGQEIVQRDLGDCVEEDELNIEPLCNIYEETNEGVTYRTTRSRHYITNYGPVEVPLGHIFVMGDHRDRSNDSTNPRIGPVSVTRVKGKALFIYMSHTPAHGFRGDRFFEGVD